MHSLIRFYYVFGDIFVAYWSVTWCKFFVRVYYFSQQNRKMQFIQTNGSTCNEHVFNFWIKIYFYVFVGHEVKHVGGKMKKNSHQKAENLNKMTLE